MTVINSFIVINAHTHEISVTEPYLCFHISLLKCFIRLNSIKKLYCSSVEVWILFFKDLTINFSLTAPVSFLLIKSTCCRLNQETDKWLFFQVSCDLNSNSDLVFRKHQVVYSRIWLVRTRPQPLTDLWPPSFNSVVTTPKDFSCFL